MKPCKCSGNNSLKACIGAIRCECGGELNLAQTLQRIISRLDECDEQYSELVQGLVAADMGQCGICGEWFRDKDLIRAGDRACCDRCFTWEHFSREEDDQETEDAVIPVLMRVIYGRRSEYHQKPYVDLLPHDHKGRLVEPFLSAARSVSL